MNIIIKEGDNKNRGYEMNRCESYAICVLGDISKYLGCRKPGCPNRTMADVPSPFINQGGK